MRILPSFEKVGSINKHGSKISESQIDSLFFASTSHEAQNMKVVQNH